MTSINSIKEFPGINMISFHSVFKSLEELKNDTDEQLSHYASDILKEMEAYPQLIEGFSDPALLEKYEKQIRKLTRVLFPDVLALNEIKAITPPFNMKTILKSKRFENILKDAGDDFQFEFEGISDDMYYIYGCATILGAHYGYNIKLSKPFTVEIPNKATGRSGFYRIAFNADMIEIEPTEKSVPITEEIYHELMNHFDDIERWKKYFPPQSWVYKGIGVVNLIDVTQDYSTAQFTANLLDQNTSLDKIKDNIRTIFKIPDLEIGFIAFEDGKFMKPPDEKAQSILMHDKYECNSQEIMCAGSHDMLINKDQPIAITDVELFHSRSQSRLTEILLDQNIQSFLMVPIKNEATVLGYIELGSSRKYELHKGSLTTLADVVPIMEVAVRRFKEETANKIEAIIQQECTTIHPSVKWRFEEQATEYFMQKERGEKAAFQDIIFPEVYPLYGQLDIKSSSTKRNDAVVKDLNAQLKAVRKILLQAFKLKGLPSYEELIFRIDNYTAELKSGLSAGSEHQVHDFVNREIYPVFDHLKKTEPSIATKIAAYNRLVDKNLNVVYDARKDFDESVTLANHMMASYIDKKQVEAQEMFPHYFERYKTDGLEFNMYIGQSIVKDEAFNPLFLRNLRLWQLITVCEIEREFAANKDSFPTDLEIASLILLYNTPLAIHFRMDEKRFDVEGAYNARYEIVKKRVDKALIKGTKDRITIPGKIAIIYTNHQDRQEYMTYIRFLESKGLIEKGSLEDHLLDDLQGITGLKALRVAVNYDKIPSKGVSYDELIEVTHGS